MPQKRLVLKIADPNLPYGGTWTHELAEDGAGTVVAVTERGEIYNPIFRAMARLFFGYHSTMEKTLRQLGKHFGEETAPRRVA